MKSRGRNWQVNNQPGYMIVDWRSNSVIDGADCDLSLDDVEQHVIHWTKPKERPAGKR